MKRSSGSRVSRIDTSLLWGGGGDILLIQTCAPSILFRICYGILLLIRKYGFVNHVTGSPVLEYTNFLVCHKSFSYHMVVEVIYVAIYSPRNIVGVRIIID